MKVLCLGGAGKISRESVHDLVEFSDFKTITIGDFNEQAGCEVVAGLNDPRVDFRKVDIHDHAATVRIMQGYDIVMDGTTISLNDRSTACIAEAGVHGINLNGFGDEYKYDSIFKRFNKVHVPGFGMTPGITDMMAKFAIDRLDQVDTVRISHGAFRPIAFSASITETTTTEYDPKLPGRVVYENGQFVQVPPFARPLDVELPGPYGTHPEYIIPHSETKTVAAYLEEQGKQARLIEVRGTWPPQNMQLVRALYDWGILRNDKIKIAGVEIGIMDAVSAYLMQYPVGQETKLYGYALHVDVTGTKDGQKLRYLLTHTHPASDGSVAGWEKLRAYTRCVGIPMGIATALIAKGKVKQTGVVAPEFAFDPEEIFRELEKRQIFIHIRIENL
ncbi:MAG: saccharopine dehydrogenase NADP-binding domain-containing protein [Deltaproteobacteria bacterium]|nr:saccharopine dehydrogenase NADP-binding domain-containing protein [Deltaproteobacteria bacterium]